MFRKFVLIFSLISITLSNAYAKERDSVAFDGALGLPSIVITNPDKSEAGYGGVSLQGRMIVPFVADGLFAAAFHGVLRYHDLENKFKSGDGVEVANHIGPGIGLTFSFGRINLGYEYMLMKARHYYIGKIGIASEYDYNVGNAFAGFTVPFGDLGLGISYSHSTGSISSEKTGLSTNSDINEQTVWIHLRLDTGAGLSQFTKNILK